MSAADAERLGRAYAAIDAANADDPASLVIDGKSRPKELAHAELAVDWVRRLRPDASDALLLAARASHVRRWELPRSAEPEGKAGYLRWKRRLQVHHAEIAGQIVADVGYDESTVARVQSIVRKEALRRDPEVQTLEDALALVFVETQFRDLASRLDVEHMVDVVAKTLRKMSSDGRAAATRLDLEPDDRAIVEQAIARL